MRTARRAGFLLLLSLSLTLTVLGASQSNSSDSNTNNSSNIPKTIDTTKTDSLPAGARSEPAVTGNDARKPNKARPNSKSELSSSSPSASPASLVKTRQLLRELGAFLPELGGTVVNGQPLTAKQSEVLKDLTKRLGSTISALPNMFQSGNSTADLLKLLTDSGLLQFLTSSASAKSSNVPGTPTSEPYTVDWLKCRADMLIMVNGLATRQMWALKMIDSWGKPESSILRGNTGFLGNNAECRSVHYTNTTTFANVQGNMCRMSIYLEATKDLLAGTGEITPIYFDVCLPRSCQSQDLNKALKQIVKRDDGSPIVTATCTADLDIGQDPWAIVAVVILSIFLALMVAGTLTEFCVGSRSHLASNLINAFIPSNSTTDLSSNGVSSIATDGGLGKHHGHFNGGFEMRERSSIPTGDDTDAMGKNYPYRRSFVDAKWLTGSSSHGLPRQSGVSDKKPSDDTAHLSKWQRLLLAFSLPRNTGKILGVTPGPGSIGCLHGIRVFSMAWVILGHVIIFAAGSNNFKNRLSIYDLTQTFLFQTIVNAPLSVDSFFFMSGLLTAYLFLKECGKKEKVTMRQGILYYVHRYWRLTPPMMIWIMIVSCLVKYVGEGRPGWVDYPAAQVCRDNWWLNMLYIQNLWIERSGCLGVTWFLANDMQFYMLAPLVMIPWVYRQRIMGYIMAAMLITVHLASNAWLVYDYNFDIVRQGEGYSSKLYFRPWSRVGPFAIGLLFGYILYRTKCKMHINKFLVVIGWILAVGFMLTVTLVTYDENKNLFTDPSGWPVEGKVVYEMLSRPGWAVMLGWIVVACATGHGGFINSILSWDGFLPLSRLTYCAFLVHLTIMNYEFMSPDSTQLYTITNLIYRFFGMYVMSYAVAFLLAVGVEAPMLGMEKVALAR
ncbi:hypothetical protein RRG08_034271 [Elysia crispata]|uniref:Nose resistant-to-fluoxetine protein N-terminal domain-containing protein n=1 Tax=Elysia crispata TaxID=231223 RepID=A0AAE1A140_9GAST|nr:hypothetical protein RRG08_034271 [Elysia crispata]